MSDYEDDVAILSKLKGKEISDVKIVEWRGELQGFTLSCTDGTKFGFGVTNCEAISITFEESINGQS